MLYVLILWDLLRAVTALDNGLARTPAMGWNPYNAFLCDAVESQYRDAAQSLLDLGLKDLGYGYLNLDCGWQGSERDSNGQFIWNETRLPSGPSGLAQHVHDLGLKFGVYSTGGYFSCDFVGGTAGWLGSLHHEIDDANIFAEWGMDYLKYDNCYAVSETDFVNFDPPIEIKPHYETMRDALNATGRPVLFAACEWGVQDPANWPGHEVANSWRISNDIGPPASWENLKRIMNEMVPITQAAGPGGWNDLDMLEVGNDGFTLAEQQTHFAFWAAAKSPLIISTDLSSISDEALAILKNERVIALNQDPLGQSISFRRRYTDSSDIWSGDLADGAVVALAINLQNTEQTLALHLSDVGLASANAEDIVSGNSLGHIDGSYTAAVAAHDIVVLKLTDGSPSIPPEFTSYQAAADTSILDGGAFVRQVNDSVSVVGNVGNGGTLTLTEIDGGSVGGTKLLSIDYINADVAFVNTQCSNCRNAFISVNGGEAQKTEMPISGMNWNAVFENYLVSASGFNSGNANTIEISNPDGWAPDFYRIGVAD